MDKDKMSFYVFNNLRGPQEGIKCKVFRYDTLDEAIAKFKELPDSWTTAIGGSVGTYELDFVHRIAGKPALVWDYRRSEKFSTRDDIEDIINRLLDNLKIEYDQCVYVHPDTSVLSRRNGIKRLNSYYDELVLDVDKVSRNGIGINEVYVEDHGWMDMKDFLSLDTDYYKNNYHPVVSFVNVRYRNIRTGRKGQADMSPQEYDMFRNKTNEYIREQEKGSLDSRIDDIQKNKEMTDRVHKDVTKDKQR